MIMKRASRRCGIATTPSTQLQVEKLKEITLSQHFQIVLDPMLDDVVDARHELLQALQTVVHVGLVAIDVHRRPGQRHHARPELGLHVVEVRPQDHGRHRDDHAHDAVVFI